VPNFESPAEGIASSRLQKSKQIFDSLDASATDAPREREGLPPTYRMRADPHYVDLLAARTSHGRERTLAVQSIDGPVVADTTALSPLIESIRRHGVLQPLLVQDRDGVHRLIAGGKRLSAAIAAGLREVPCLLFDVNDEEAERLAAAARTAITPEPPKPQPIDTSIHLGGELAQSLTTLSACADLLAGSQSELSRAVVGNLIRAEVWRASCLLQATRIVRQELPVARSAMSVLGVLDRIDQGFLPERRVRAIELETRADVAHGSIIAADERLLDGAVAGAVVATIALLDGVKGARLTLSAVLEPDAHVTFVVSQDNVSVPEIWASRAFDPQWTDRPGGLPATVAMQAVTRAADAHGGQAAAALSARGTRIMVTVPTGL
jgi:hypothetical protein